MKEGLVMTDLTDFNEVYRKLQKTLKQYVPVVERVHGDHHPEFYKVRAIYNTIVEKIENKDFKLNEEFNALNQVTSAYHVPDDVCETYEAVYLMLSELARVYKTTI